MIFMSYHKFIGSSSVDRVLAGQKLGDSTDRVKNPAEGNCVAQQAIPMSADVRDLITSAPLVETRLAAEPSAEASSEAIQVPLHSAPDESPCGSEYRGDASTSSGYVEPPPLAEKQLETTAATWRAADDALTCGKAVHVARRGVKEVDDPSHLCRTTAVTHGLSCDWEDDLCLEDNTEYIHENVRRYRKPARGSHRCVDVFLRLGRDLGDNFYWGTYLTTAQGHRIWTWRLYQLPASEVVALREKEVRHMRKCGLRVAIKPLGVNPDVLRLALQLFPVGNIHMRHALSLPEAPKTCAEVIENKARLADCVSRSSGKLPCYHYYKDKLTLVREGIEPNPGPAAPENTTAYARESVRYAEQETELIQQLVRRYQWSKEDRRTIADVLSSARFVRGAAAYNPQDNELDETVWAGHGKLIEALKEDTAALFEELKASLLVVRDQKGIDFPTHGIFPNFDVDVRFWYILLDVVQADLALAGTAFERYLPRGTLVLLGMENKSHLLGQEIVVDPRVAPQSGPQEADIPDIDTHLVDQGGVFDDPHIEVVDATKKRDARREIWSKETAAPTGLIDLCRYVLCTPQSSPYRLRGIYKGLVKIHEKTGRWEIDEKEILQAIEVEERRGAKIADSGLAMGFTVDEGLFPMYFTDGDEDDHALRKKLGLYEGDVVVSVPDHACVKKENVYELTAANGAEELVLTVRCMVSGEQLKFLYPHRWCKLATKRLYGCCSTLEEAVTCCRTLISWTDHTEAAYEMANHQHLRVKAFAAALYGLANCKPGESLSEAEVLRRVSEFRPVAGGVYHEAYTTDSTAVTDKYRDLAQPCYTVGDHTVDNSFIVIRDPAAVKLNPSARLAREGPEVLIPAYARPDPNSLWEQVQGVVKRLSVGRLPLKEEWRKRLEDDVWPAVKAYIEGKADSLDVLAPNDIYHGCEEHAKLKGFKGIELDQYLGGAALFLRGASGEENLLDEAWRTEYGCFTKSENYALSGKKPTRSIQCPDMFVRGYQHALLANAQHNLFVRIFPHLTIKHLTEDEKMEKIRRTFANAERIVCTDLTAMEKNVSSFMMTFERKVFKACSPTWMHKAIDQAWDELMFQPRAISHKMFDLFVDPMRASGEDHTSAGNFVCNLMWICAWTNDAAAILSGARPCLVEGDDGQVGADGLQLPNADQIAGLGIRIKLEESVGDSSFVSKVIKNDRPVCDALSIAQNFSVIRDPDLDSNHGDAAKQYAMAMSYYYLYGGYPIIGPYFLGYLMRHHDAVMGTQTGLLAVKKAFCAKYVGWVDPADIEAMWQDVLRSQALPRPAVKTTAADLAEVSGVSVHLLQQIYSCRPTEYANSVPSGGRFTVDDQTKAVVHAAHCAAKKNPPCRIDSAPRVLVDTWGWWLNLLLGWLFVTTNKRSYDRLYSRRVMIVTGRMGTELRQKCFVPKVERRLSYKRLLIGMMLLGIGTAGALEATTVVRTRGPQLQAFATSCRSTTIEGWRQFQDAKADWTVRYQILRGVASDLWRDLRYRLHGHVEDVQIGWYKAFGRRTSEIADVEEMSLLLDKPLVPYVSPKEQWKVFWKGVEPHRLRWKLAQVLLFVPWFIMLGALACRDHLMIRTVLKVDKWTTERVVSQPHRQLAVPVLHQDVEPADWFASFDWQAVVG